MEVYRFRSGSLGKIQLQQEKEANWKRVQHLIPSTERRKLNRKAKRRKWAVERNLMVMEKQKWIRKSDTFTCIKMCHYLKKTFKIRNLVYNLNALNLLNIAGPKEDRYLKQKTQVYPYKTILKRRNKMIIKLVQLKK